MCFGLEKYDLGGFDIEHVIDTFYIFMHIDKWKNNVFTIDSKENWVQYLVGLTKNTIDENLSSFIELAKPERWKILQVLSIKNQNDNHINNLLISKADFKAFTENNLINSAIIVIVEFNNDMTNSYLMIDPAGRFYQNTNGMYNYSKPILEVGIIKALKETEISTDKYYERGAKYNW